MNDDELRERLDELEQQAETHQRYLGDHAFASGIRTAIDHIRNGLDEDDDDDVTVSDLGDDPGHGGA